MQAIRSARPGGAVGYVGVSHDVQLPGDELFYSHVRLLGGPAPVARFLPGPSTGSGAGRSTRARSSTSPCPWLRSLRATGPWTSAARSKTLLTL